MHDYSLRSVRHYRVNTSVTPREGRKDGLDMTDPRGQ